MSILNVSEILQCPPPSPAAGTVIGASRAGRKLVGYRFGTGGRHVSLIAGCHADEPVGPAMLDRLVSWLDRRPAGDPLVAGWSFWIVPHANPDGEARNAGWAGMQAAALEPGAYDLAAYLQGAVRELPGDDVEFGFPREATDDGARPENRAIADFLAGGAPFVLHGSFHGMAFAAGPWFLIEASWADRTVAMRDRLRQEVDRMGYVVHDIDRGGEKGFHRIDEGFTTRPDSRAMIAHFQALGDAAMADRFRPSSMENVRSLGGDPLTLVSEMPLFLLERRHFEGENLVYPKAIAALRRHAAEREALAAAADTYGVRPMPIRDQMGLQLAFLEESLAAVSLGAR